MGNMESGKRVRYRLIGRIRYAAWAYNRIEDQLKNASRFEIHEPRVEPIARIFNKVTEPTYAALQVYGVIPIAYGMSS
jgi:hypothetical protein